MAADYTVVITWGDGISTPVAATTSGSGFAAGATHGYRHTGKYSVAITITDTGGASLTRSKSITVR